MGLKVWGTDPENQPKPREDFSDDLVGRFRSGHQINGQPASLTEWRVTTGDPDVADAIYELLGGQEPQEWDAKGEDNLEVFTSATEVEIILDNPKALKQEMILWTNNGKVAYVTDGEYLADGTPDPDAELSFEERKQKHQLGIGPGPHIQITFKLADDPDLGYFKFTSGSWTLVKDLVYYDVEAALEAIDGPTRALLSLEEVTFTAKSGKRKGKPVSFTKPNLKVLGPVEVKAAA